MSARIEVNFSKSAEDDLLDLVEWYASRQTPETGTRIVGAVIERVDQLVMFPDSGKIVPEFDTPWLRELEFPPYRIVYRREDTTVSIVRIWRSERLMDPSLNENA